MSLPQSAIISPAVWLGSGQQRKTDWMYLLPEAEKRGNRRRHPFSSASAGTCGRVKAPEYPIPVVAAVVEHWMRDLDDGRGFLLVRGFPAEV